MPIITEFMAHNHDEWLAIRQNYVGGSDAGAVLGVDPYKSPYALWAEKTGRVEPFAGNIATEVGTRLEALVAELFTQETGLKVRRKNATMVNSLYPFACANVDRIVTGQNALLEIKTTTSIPVMRKVRGGDYPDKWYAQMTHYMAVTGARKAYLAVLVNCRELHIYTLDRDQAEIDALMAAEARFWELVEKDTPPDPDASCATTDALTEVYPDSNGESVELFGRESLLREWESLKAAQKSTEERLRGIENQLKADMGSAERGEAGEYTVTWKSQTRSTFQAKAFAADNPGIDLTPYYKTTATRPFTIRKKSNKEDNSNAE